MGSTGGGGPPGPAGRERREWTASFSRGPDGRARRAVFMMGRAWTGRAEPPFLSRSPVNNLVKFGIALTLAAVAGGLNCVYVQSQVATDSYVRVAKAVPAGRTVAESDLTTIEFPQRVGKLDATLIPWAKRHTIVGIVAPRTFAVGDLVLQQDLPPAPLIGRYEALGPFELIAVESQYSSRSEAGDRLSSGTRTEKITIAVPEDLDPKTRKLLDLLVAGRPATDKKAVHVAGLLIVGSPGTTAVEARADPPAELEIGRAHV